MINFNTITRLSLIPALPNSAHTCSFLFLLCICAPTIALGYFCLFSLFFKFPLQNLAQAWRLAILVHSCSFCLPRYNFLCWTIHFPPLLFSIPSAFKILLKGKYSLTSVILFIKSYGTLLYKCFLYVFINLTSRKLKPWPHFCPWSLQTS